MTANIYIIFNSVQAGTYMISVTDMSGKELYAHSYDAIAGSNIQLIDTNGLAAGTYIMKITNGYGVQKIKFGKQ